MATTAFTALFAWTNNSIEEDDLQPGDHIYRYIAKSPVQHHGIVISVPSPEYRNILPLLSYVKVMEMTSGEHQGIREVHLYDFLTSCGRYPMKQLKRVKYGVCALTEKTRIFPGGCHTTISHPPQDVVERARILKRWWEKPPGFVKGALGTYDLVASNCEQFAIYCNTG